MSSKLTPALMAQILADGIIDADEAKNLDGIIFEDGIVERDEMDFLFDLNDQAKGTSSEFDALLAKAACNHVLNDEKTPGVVSADEAEYLIGKIKGDGVVKTNETLIVATVLLNAKTVDPSLTNFAKDIGLLV